MRDTRPAAMVVLASEQLWPNLQGLVCWKEQDPGLRHLKIYVTTDELRSQEPARRLRRFCESRYRDIAVEIPHSPLGMRPQEVQGQIERWMRDLPGHRWVINATGGNKLMTCGAIAFAGRPDVLVIYREIGSEDWYELRRNGEKSPLEAHRFCPPGEAMDRIPVEELVRSLWILPENAEVRSKRPERLPLPDLTRALIEEHWDWHGAFRRIGRPSPEQAGFLFERYVAAGLLEMGIRNAIMNVEARSPQGQALQEVDIVAHHRGRLVILDCKLRSKNEEGITTQIRHAEGTRRQMGGLGAELVLVRPLRSLAEAERELAKALRLGVIDREDAPRLFSHLKDFFKAEKLPESLAAVERMLNGHLPVFGHDLEGTPPAPEGWGPGMLNLNPLLQKQGWAAWVTGNTGFLACIKPRDWSREQLTEVIQKAVSPMTAVGAVRIISEGGPYLYELQPSRKGAFEALSRDLPKHLQQGLLGPAPAPLSPGSPAAGSPQNGRRPS